MSNRQKHIEWLKGFDGDGEYKWINTKTCLYRLELMTDRKYNETQKWIKDEDWKSEDYEMTQKENTPQYFYELLDMSMEGIWDNHEISWNSFMTYIDKTKRNDWSLRKYIYYRDDDE